jgi:hypothetical protein
MMMTRALKRKWVRKAEALLGAWISWTYTFSVFAEGYVVRGCVRRF